MIRSMIFGAVGSVALTAGAAFAASMSEQLIILGSANYNANCADCHGAAGKGDGPYAENLIIKPADLTSLTRDAGGAFPFSELYEVIDGTKIVRTHDVSAMPVWGDAFMADTLMDRGLSKTDAEHIVQGRILSLLYYLQTLQE